MTTLLTGQLTKEGLREALEFVMDYKDINSGVVDVSSGEMSGRIGVAWGRFITGATLSSGERGRKALRTILSWEAGKFTFIDTEGKPVIELRQSLGIDMSAIINQLPIVSVSATPTLYDADELPKKKISQSQFELEEPSMATEVSESGLSRLEMLYGDSLSEQSAPLSPPPIDQAVPEASDQFAATPSANADGDQKWFDNQEFSRKSDQQPAGQDHDRQAANPHGVEQEPDDWQGTPPQLFQNQNIVSLELSPQELAALRSVAQEIASHGSTGSDFDAQDLDKVEHSGDAPDNSIAAMAAPPWSWESAEDEEHRQQFSPLPPTAASQYSFAVNEVDTTHPSTIDNSFPQPPAANEQAGAPSPTADIAQRPPLHIPSTPEFHPAPPEPGWTNEPQKQTFTDIEPLPFEQAGHPVAQTNYAPDPPPVRPLEPGQNNESGEYKYLRLKEAAPAPDVAAPQPASNRNPTIDYGANDRLLSAGTMAGAWDAFEALQPQTNRETLLRLRKRQDSDTVGIAIFCFLFFVVSCAGTVMFLPKALIFLAGVLHVTH